MVIHGPFLLKPWGGAMGLDLKRRCREGAMTVTLWNISSRTAHSREVMFCGVHCCASVILSFRGGRGRTVPGEDDNPM